MFDFKLKDHLTGLNIAGGANLYAKSGIYEKCRVVPQLEREISKGARIDRHCTVRGNISTAYDRSREEANAILKGGIRETGRHQLGQSHAVEKSAGSLHVKHQFIEFTDCLNKFLSDDQDPKSRRARLKLKHTTSSEYVENHSDLLILYGVQFEEAFDVMFEDVTRTIGTGRLADNTYIPFFSTEGPVSFVDPKSLSRTIVTKLNSLPQVSYKTPISRVTPNILQKEPTKLVRKQHDMLIRSRNNHDHEVKSFHTYRWFEYTRNVYLFCYVDQYIY